MTKAQLWIAAFVGLFIILFLLQKVTSESIASSTPPLVEELGFISCLGQGLNGGGGAPSLVGLSSVYKKEQIMQYIKNPESSPRFAEFKTKYPNPMRPFKELDDEKLGILADYILSLK